MRVKDCQNCKHCQRRTWHQYHVPKSSHPVGFTHAYYFCTKHQKRVREVKKCQEVSDGSRIDKHTA